jgi:hypothetical protein
MDTALTVAGPIFVFLAIVLILICMWAFYVAVFGAVRSPFCVKEHPERAHALYAHA